jgi:hypothetical protein
MQAPCGASRVRQRASKLSTSAGTTSPASTRTTQEQRATRRRRPHRRQPGHKRDNHPHRSQDTSDQQGPDGRPHPAFPHAAGDAEQRTSTQQTPRCSRPLVLVLVPELGSGRLVCAHGERPRARRAVPPHPASGYHAYASQTGSATAAGTGGLGKATRWRGQARATAGTHRPAFLRGRAPARPLLSFPASLQEKMSYRHKWVRKCPGRLLVSKGADTIPGKAAAIYDGKKAKTYSGQANFVRINAASLHFLSRILPLEAEGTAGLTRALHCPASHGHWRVHTCTCC